ncbi:glycosyltransferase family 4 protein [Bordetella bronchialis]|uniref:Glycosyl transferase group 1 n=1 Tax=Bordetella bronchialis TaxID=463025 RepID=A0A193FN52_9BORD|nr:glycosyltransferase family 4 protein [Bordetella bronchialis]ANN69090.1 glycosyl transferase group 1 [Bordetella bronchialis]ANN74238.1 glycosyl transferase group 1 [Bordetella bronchialis]
MSYQVWVGRAKRALRFRKEHGFLELTRRAALVALNPNVLKKIPVAESLEFTRLRPFGAPVTVSDVDANTINWFIPRPGRGSGGHLNIFRFIRNLEELGFECRIISSTANLASIDAAQMEKDIAEWFFPLRAKVYIGAESAPPAAISVATGWHTAYDVRNFRSTLHKCYFVQDFEPFFYAAGTEYALAEETYRFGFIGLTAGNWLADKLRAEYGMETHPVGFSYDREFYKPQPSRPRSGKAVFFYARPLTPRRGFELGVAVLAEVVRRIPDVSVIMAGGRLSGFEIPFAYEDVGIVDLDKLAELYGRCDVSLVLSFSNLSLLPLELMACGVPVVSNRAPCTEWLLNDSNCRLEGPSIDALASAICDVLENPAEAERLRLAGLETAHGTDWAVEGRRMAAVFSALTQDTGRKLPGAQA